MFDDPKIVQLIIIALIGIIVVLTIAVIYLAIKKNTYYVDENGEEITSFSTKKEEPERMEVPSVETPIPVQPLRGISVDDEEETEEEGGTLEVPMSDKPADITAVDLTITVEDETSVQTISAFPCMIGRETSCGLVISEPAVSRRHALLISEMGALYIEPVSEHNGTFVNGNRLPSSGRSSVYENDRINLGRAEIVVGTIRH